MSRVNDRCLLFVICFVLIGCVEPIDIDTDDDQGRQLVVEGWVNNVNDIVVVRLLTSTVSGVGENTLGAGATVSIVTGSGRRVLVEEFTPGLYATLADPLAGEVGESYQLEIQLADGRSYESEVVTIPEPLAFGQIRDEFVENSGTTDEGVEFVNYAHDIFTELRNTEEQHFVQLIARGWSNLRVDYEFTPAGPLTCWQRQDPVNREIVLATNTGLSGDFYESLVTRVPVDFRGNYVVEITANTMSAEAFAFWSEAKAQLDRGGGVFDPPFAPVVGNIRNVTDPEEVVLGFFHAYGYSSSRHCYSRLGVPGQFRIPIIPNSVTLCTDIYEPAVFELPFGDEICPDTEN